MLGSVPGGEDILGMTAGVVGGKEVSWEKILSNEMADAFAAKIKEEESRRLAAIEELRQVQESIIGSYTEQNNNLITALNDLTQQLAAITGSPALSAANNVAAAAGAAGVTNTELAPDRAANPVTVNSFRMRLNDGRNMARNQGGRYSNDTILKKLEELEKEYKDTFGEFSISNFGGHDENSPMGRYTNLYSNLSAREKAAKEGTGPKVYQQTPATTIPNPVIPKPATASTPTGTPPIPAKASTTVQTTASKTVTTGGLFNIDEATKTFLTQFKNSMDSFGSYVTRMENIANNLPKIPERIEMQGRHTVSVTITGDKVWASLEGRMLELVQGEVDKKMKSVWNKSGGEMGSSGAGGRSTWGDYVP